jgi:tetratricopeptide (TPR) repeat protein
MSEPLARGIDLADCADWESARILKTVRGRGSWLRKRQRKTMVLHLLAGCERCGQKLRMETLAPSDLSASYPSTDGVDTVDTKLFSRSLVRLEGLERPAQELYLSGVPGLSTPEFVRWLTGECRVATTREPERAVGIAKLGVLASKGLDANVKASAAMRMGQVLRRARGDFLGADTWFDKARDLLEDPSSDPALLAKLLRLQGYSRFSQSRSDEALPLFRHAARIYQSIGDLDGLGKTLVDQSGALEESEGTRAAIGSLMKACCFVDLSTDKRLALVIAQNLSLYHTNLGQTEVALGYLTLARQLLEEEGSAPVDALRMDWSAGRILAEAGQYGESLAVFETARNGFVELGLAAEAGQISLDLSLSLLQLGRVQELKEVAQEMLPIFRSRLLHKEAFAAVQFFREAAVAETITAAQIHAVSKFLTELESNSRARFRKPS